MADTYVVLEASSTLFSPLPFSSWAELLSAYAGVLVKFLHKSGMDEIWSTSLHRYPHHFVAGCRHCLVKPTGRRYHLFDRPSMAGLAVGLAASLQNFAAGVMLIIFWPFKSGLFHGVYRRAR